MHSENFKMSAKTVTKTGWVLESFSLIYNTLDIPDPPQRFFISMRLKLLRVP